MAGKPNSRTVVQAVEKAASDAGRTPLEYVCDRLAGGDYLSTIAKELDINRSLLATYVNSLPEAKAKLKEARSEGAHGMFEQALEVWDANLDSKEAIAIAKGKSDTLLWGAQRLGRGEFGDDKQAISLNVNLGNLSLDAMRARLIDNTAHTRARLIEAGPVVIATSIVDDAIVLSDDDTTT